LCFWATLWQITHLEAVQCLIATLSEDLLTALPMRHKAATVKLCTELGLLSPGNGGKKLMLNWLYLEQVFFLNEPLPWR